MIRKRKFGFRNQPSRSMKARRPKFFSGDRSLRFESMEGRLVLSAVGLPGNACAPELMDGVLTGIVSGITQPVSPGNNINFQFSANNVVTDSGDGATPTGMINFTLDPTMLAANEDPPEGVIVTPEGATLTPTPATDDDIWVFDWTPTEMQRGTYRLAILAIDAGGDNNLPLSDSFAFDLTISDLPVVDLDGGDQTNLNFTSSFTEDAGPISIVDNDLSIPFAASDMIASATVQINPANLQADSLEVLSATASGNVIISPASTPDTLVLAVNGGELANKSEFETVLRTLMYDNTSNNPNAQQTVNVTVNDGTNDSAAAVATINITPMNDAPDLLVIPNALQTDPLPDAEIEEMYSFELIAEDIDESTRLIFQLGTFPDGAVIKPSSDLMAAGGLAAVVTPDADGRFRATVEWTPVAGQGDNMSGTELFTVRVNDTGQLSDEENYTVKIINNPPNAKDDPETPGEGFFVLEDDGDTVIGNVIDGNDTDPEDDDFFVHMATGSGDAVAAGTEFTTAKGTVTVAANGTVNYNPNNAMFQSLGAFDANDPSTFMTDTFTYTLIDTRGGISDPATVTVTIRGENDAPEKVSPEVIPEFPIPENAAAMELALADLQAAAMDVDDDVASLSVAEVPDNPVTGGLFTLDGGVLRFNPNGAYDAVAPGATQEVPAEVKLQDSSGGMVTINVKIIIQGVNNGPTVENKTFGDINEDQTLTVPVGTGLLEGATDDGGTASIEVAEVNGITDMFGQAIEITDASGRRGNLTVETDGSFSFVPGPDFDALAMDEPSIVTFNFKAKDGDDAPSNLGTVTINITGVNDAPTSNDDNKDTDAAFMTDEDTALAGANVLTNDADPDTANNALTVSKVNGMDNDGSELTLMSAGDREVKLTVASDGTVSFTPGDAFDTLAQDAVDTVMFNYNAFDGMSEDPTAATAIITINGVNDAPKINREQLASALQTALGLGDAPDLTMPIEVTSGEEFTFDFSSVVSDPDTPVEDLRFGRTEFNLPGVNEPVLDDTTGAFTWTPSATDTPMNLSLALSVNDMTSLFDLVNLTFRVVAPN